MRVFTQDEMERDRYLARLEYQQMVKDIRKADRAEAQAEGLAEGLAEGRVEGRVEGRDIVNSCGL